MNFNEYYTKFSIQTQGGYSSSDCEFAAEESWEACKKEVLKILQQNWHGADLSINSCDEHYIEKIKKL